MTFGVVLAAEPYNRPMGIPALARKDRRGLAALAGMLLFAASAATPQQTQPPAADRDAIQTLLSRAASLRRAVDGDYRQAFRDHGSPRVGEQIDRLDKVAWRGVKPQLGWSFFLGTSPMAIAAASGKKPLTAFYHPWSDIVLLLEWERTDSALRITDVALLDAEIFRAPQAPAPGPDPGWAEAEEFAPLAIARATAEVIDAFETLYPADFQGDWRDPLAAWSQPDYRALNDSAVGLRLLRTMAMFAALRTESSEQAPEVAALTAAAERFRGGDLDSLLTEARLTPPRTREMLRQAPPGVLAVLAEVSAIPAKPSGVIFLAPPDSPDYFVSLLVSGEESAKRIERIDLVDYLNVVEVFKREGER